MKASIVQIGNSKGIRIPKPILEQCGLVDEVELDVRNNELVICSLKSTRPNWSKSFRSMRQNGDDALIFDDTQSSWDEDGWEWK